MPQQMAKMQEMLHLRMQVPMNEKFLLLFI
ncbi:hypothetical protein OIU78_000792 [Salix suchowensis]|nr:hypothetical protein OIU78_000792 [Salix suchowensis]